MSDICQQQEENMKEITQILKSERYLMVLSEDLSYRNNLGFSFCLHVQDEMKKEYSLLVNHKSNQKDLHSAKIRSKYLKSLDHPNIIQYINDFTIGNYYFLQTERIYTCLFQWINDVAHKGLIRELNYVEIMIQLLDVTYYLNKNNCSLSLQSTLQSFTIDQERKVKLIHFTIPKQINIAQVKTIFNECKEQNQLFYYRKEILKMNNSRILWQNFEIDQWVIGICLYYLSGASIQHILNYVKGEEPFQISDRLGFQNNIILYSLICDYMKLSYLPSFSRNIGSLQLSQQRLLRDQTQNFDVSEDTLKKKKHEQIKEDFLVYQKIHRQLQEKNKDMGQNDIINEFIGKYEQSDSFLQLQTKLFASNQNFEEATRCTEEIVKINPLSDTGYFNLGKIYELQGNLGESIKFYEKSIAINPLNDITYQNIGVIHQDMNSSETIKYYKKAADVNWNNEDTLFNLGLEYDNLAKQKHASLSYKKALEINTKDADVLNNQAYFYFKQSQFEQSLCCQKQVVDLVDDYSAHDWLKNIKRSI